MYYENFEMLCKINNVKPSQVSKSTGISTATLSNWKNGTYTPKQDKLQLIADYFKTTVDFIINGKESQFTIEMADTDSKLFLMEKRMKEYAIKLSKLTDSQKEIIEKMIDEFSKE